MKKKLLLIVAAALLSMASVFAQYVDGGTTGPLTWEVTGTAPNYTLTISGTGAMLDYGGYGGTPWFEYQESITAVVIENGVITIGAGAFSQCGALASVIIPNSITSIGDNAFSHCRALTSVSLPNNVTTIGKQTFLHCSALTSIDVDSENTNYSSVDGVLFDKEKTILNCYPAGKTNSNYTIPNCVTTIENSAFCGCSALTSVTLPNSVTTIGIWAFYGCSALTSVTIPNSVTTIGNDAFSTCGMLASVIFGNSLTTIGDNAFSYCVALASVTIPNSVTTIGISAFGMCVALTSIDVGSENTNYSSVDGVLFDKEKTILNCYPAGKTNSSYTVPSSVTTIGNFAFCFCTALTSVTLPNSVAIIEDWAFGYCTALTSVTNLNLEPIEISSVMFSVFYGVEISTCTLKVPTSAVFAYEKAEVWKDFNIIGGGILVNPVSGNPKQGYTIGEGLYQQGKGETATITAVPYSGYKFINWTKDSAEVSTENPYSFTVTEDVELVANFEDEVGIKNLEVSDIKIYPNPTTGKLKIENGELKIENIEIYDIYGRNVGAKFPSNKLEGWQPQADGVVFNISHLPSGIYFVIITTESGVVVKKVVKE